MLILSAWGIPDWVSGDHFGVDVQQGCAVYGACQLCL